LDLYSIRRVHYDALSVHRGRCGSRGGNTAVFLSRAVHF